MNDRIDIPQLNKGTYRHSKSGKLYQVVGVALDTETNTTLVVYRPLYEHEHGYQLFTRPYDMFIEKVNIDGNLVPRFEYISS